MIKHVERPTYIDYESSFGIREFLITGASSEEEINQYVEQLWNSERFSSGLFGTKGRCTVSTRHPSKENWILTAKFDLRFEKFDRRWFTSSVVDLVKSISQSEDCALWPLLADALMDAGCDSSSMIWCLTKGTPATAMALVNLLSKAVKVSR